MLKSSARSVIRLKGVRHNNLKNFDLDLPLNQLIVITGLSGSGKSSLAFDTLFAEGQRRYIETFSPYARQFFDRMDKPQVDSIEGIPPAIAIEQRNTVKTTRSTVGTMTEICDYMKMLWPHMAQLHCRQCGAPVRKDSPQSIWSIYAARKDTPDLLITFDVPLTEKLTLVESLGLISKQGYQRLLIDGLLVRLDEAVSRATKDLSRLKFLTVVQDRLSCEEHNRARFVEACEQAYHFGKGKLTIYCSPKSTPGAERSEFRKFSNRLHCAQCDLEYREPTPALFSFNHPVGACPKCRGFGRVISIDYGRALPDRSKTLAEGVVKPWQSGQGLDCQKDLLRTCRHFEIPTNVAFEKLPKKWQEFVINGEPDYGKDEEHEWPRAWYGVKGYFRWLESKAYKMHVRVLLSRYRAYTTCPDCQGKRFQPEALLYRVPGVHGAIRPGGNSDLTLADFYQLPVRDALDFVEKFKSHSESGAHDPIALTLKEVSSRLAYLDEVGLGYLTLDRPTRSLSGGETERVNLTTCLGTCLVNTLFVLDEPSVGLHPRDTDRLVNILRKLRSIGNTVVVVEHEASVIRAADHIIDLGPGHGAAGGELVFQGSLAQLLKAKNSLTGDYLSGRKKLDLPQRREVEEPPLDVQNRYDTQFTAADPALVLQDAPYTPQSCSWLKLEGASLHNLRNLTLNVPLGRFVCVTGVSGSGKTTLIREVLLPALATRLNLNQSDAAAVSRFSESSGDAEEGDPSIGTAYSTKVLGWESLADVVLVDQSILGKTPRSNPAVYIGAFDDIRELYAQSEQAKQRGLNASAFSFNSGQGQCQKCRGAGFEKIEMQFLSDVFIRCPECHGRRYRSHILEVRLGPKSGDGKKRLSGALSIGDLLESTVDEATEFLAGFPESRSAQRARSSLSLLQEVGLGYLKLGQPINTLSGGESQRLKLVRHLATAGAAEDRSSSADLKSVQRRIEAKRFQIAPSPGRPNLFLFDEPTTGLHFDDVRVLLKVFHRLVDAGHSIIVIEHNVDVIKSADWVIDLGPGAGDEGGTIVAQGTPDDIIACAESFTGKALAQVSDRQEIRPERQAQAVAGTDSSLQVSGSNGRRN